MGRPDKLEQQHYFDVPALSSGALADFREGGPDLVLKEKRPCYAFAKGHCFEDMIEAGFEDGGDAQAGRENAEPGLRRGR